MKMIEQKEYRCPEHPLYVPMMFTDINPVRLWWNCKIGNSHNLWWVQTFDFSTGQWGEPEPCDMPEHLKDTYDSLP